MRSFRFAKNRKNALVVAALFGAAGIAYLAVSNAATQSAAIEPETSTLGNNTSIVNDATASGGKAIKFTPPAVTPPPTGTLMGWQLSATNVGLTPHGLNCAGLPLYTGPDKPARGAVISSVRVTTPLDLSNGDITVDKSCIKPTSTTGADAYLYGVTTVGNIIIRDSEVDGSHLSAANALPCAFLGVGTLQRNYMHGMGNGICFYQTGLQHSALAEGNYVTDLRSYADSHNEAATIRDFVKNTGNTRTVKFINNRLDCSADNTSAALFIQSTFDDIYNVTLEGNYFEGAGWNLYADTRDGTYGNMSAVNNRFRPAGYGPMAISGPGWTIFSENYRYDATKTDGKGAVVN